MIQNIPSPHGQYIIYKIYRDRFTEKKIAQELNISQQAVNRWKKKSLEKLRESQHSLSS
ncbi:sigma factor-like helix-turn-helix DNA-binding protein [Marinicrinis sediminis]|uniref:Sigma factor-like helix-turn-helix DNA-binding protein n=1 Tax=Marinicrinis sediminis TaxID=1652465 RepID=A0ABW5R6R2_9BACL